MVRLIHKLRIFCLIEAFARILVRQIRLKCFDFLSFIWWFLRISLERFVCLYINKIIISNFNHSKYTYRVVIVTLGGLWIVLFDIILKYGKQLALWWSCWRLHTIILDHPFWMTLHWTNSRIKWRLNHFQRCLYLFAVVCEVSFVKNLLFVSDFFIFRIHVGIIVF